MKVFLKSHLLLVHQSKDVLEHQLQSICQRDSFLEVVLGNEGLLEIVFQDSVCQLFQGSEYQEISFQETLGSSERFNSDLMSTVPNISE